MNYENLNLDFDGASVIQTDERTDEQGNKIVRQKLNNGVTWIRTETPNDGWKRIDFSHVLDKIGEDTYRINPNEIKQDFHDYY